MEKLDDVTLANDDIVFANEDLGSFTSSSDKMSILSIDINGISLDYVNFDKYYPETIIHIRIMAWLKMFRQHIYRD